MTSATTTTSSANNRVADWLLSLTQLREALPTNSETARWRSDIDNLMVQLQGQTRYAAVFGAFSAGKSSLINALLGEPRLVVSPNPTTAAITHLVPARDDKANNSRITAKSEAQLWDDIKTSFAKLHIEVDDLDTAIAQVNQLKVSQVPPAVRKSVSFLKAVADGYTDMRPRLGQSWESDDEGVRRATSEEKLACFVQRVDIAVPIPILGEGVVVVDTPGVDSIHRRHTDVAFEYMRRADIVVFVVYYSHAFSRADKEFVQQLAGIQDVIGLNKLFVVINAVDLAKSPEEREDVRTRVVGELRQLGIRQPRVYEVSSQLAMAAAQLRHSPTDERFTGLVRQRLRLSPDSPVPDWKALDDMAGVTSLQRDMAAYLADQSVELAESAVRRLKRRVSEGIDAALARTEQLRQQDAAVTAAVETRRQDYRQRLVNTLKHIQEGITEEEQALVSDWAQLSFHASERVRFRFAGVFREAFHPGRFRQGMDVGVGLSEAAQELCAALARQIEVEVRTFALRAHHQARTALERLAESLRQKSLELGVLWENERDAFAKTDTSIAVEQLRATIDDAVIRPGLRHFSSAKQFFEGGGQQTMLQTVEALLLPDCNAELRQLADMVVDATVTAFRGEWIQQVSDVLELMSRGAEDGSIELEEVMVGLQRVKGLLSDVSE